MMAISSSRLKQIRKNLAGGFYSDETVISELLDELTALAHLNKCGFENTLKDQAKLGKYGKTQTAPPPPSPGTAREPIETTDLSTLKEEPSEEQLKAMARAYDRRIGISWARVDKEPCLHVHFVDYRIEAMRSAYSAMKEVG